MHTTWRMPSRSKHWRMKMAVQQPVILYHPISQPLNTRHTCCHRFQIIFRSHTKWTKPYTAILIVLRPKNSSTAWEMSQLMYASWEELMSLNLVWIERHQSKKCRLLIKYPCSSCFDCCWYCLDTSHLTFETVSTPMIFDSYLIENVHHSHHCPLSHHLLLQNFLIQRKCQFFIQ